MLAATYDPAGVAAQLAGASGEAINAGLFRTALGATVVGSAVFLAASTAAAQAAIGGTAVGISVFTAANAAAARAAIGAGTGSGDLLAANNLSDLLSAATARTNLGGTTVGQNFFTLPNPSAVTIPSIAADNTVSAISPSAFATLISAALTTGTLAQFAATTSAQLRTLLSDELGTGAALFDGATPTSFTLTNASGLPAAGVVGTAAILGANTFTGQQIISLNGAASTPPLTLTGTIFTGGSATTTKPQLLVEPAGTTSTGWQTTGTLIGANGPAAFAGSLLDLQVVGVSKLRVKPDGALQMAGGDGIEVWNTTASGLAGSRMLCFNSYMQLWDGSGNAIWSGWAGEFHIGPSLTFTTQGSQTSAVGDLLLKRKAAAILQMGADAAGVTNQTFTAANRITSDGVGANLTIAAGNGRGGAAGNLVLSSWTTEATGTAGTLTTIGTIDINGLTIASGKDITLGNAAAVGAALVSTHSVTIKDSTGTTYRLMALV